MTIKTYLGDGVYVAVDARGVVLTTEDGIAVTNTIVLEPEVYERFRQFIEFSGSRRKVAR